MATDMQLPLVASLLRRGRLLDQLSTGLTLLALALAPYSMLASVICLVFLGIYLSASGILTVLLTRKLIDRYGKASAVPFALNA